jgi:ribonuclease HII
VGKRSPEQEEQRVYALYEQQRQAGAAACVIGVDEVGRGPVAGPLTVAAVALPLEPPIEGLDDSKKLSAAKREALAKKIYECALGVGISHIEPDVIDTIGMAAALRAAMIRAIEACERALEKADLVLIDGNPMWIHDKEQCIVKGDSKVACIAAASIVAKVTRDALMDEADELYPGYGFASNKGYASAAHIAAIKEKGLCPLHRRSFCGNFMQQSLF